LPSKIVPATLKKFVKKVLACKQQSILHIVYNIKEPVYNHCKTCNIAKEQPNITAGSLMLKKPTQ
jgi:hypothetical protein